MNTNKSQSRLCIGTAQFGMKYGISNNYGEVSDDQFKLILGEALNNGITTLDTAAQYGEAHKRLGSYGVNNFTIVTKLSLPSCSELTIDVWVRKQVMAYLERLSITSIYGLLIHDTSVLHTTLGSGIVLELLRMQDEGIVKKIGISIYSPNEYYDCKKIFKFQLVQAPLNIMDRRLLNGCLMDMSLDGIEFFARSIFLQGLLTMSKEEQLGLFGEWGDIWNAWHKWLSYHQFTPIQACLGFAKSIKLADKIIVGVQSHDQIKEIIKFFSNDVKDQWPEISCDDENLINPVYWSRK